MVKNINTDYILILIIFFSGFASKLFPAHDITLILSFIYILLNFQKIYPNLKFLLIILLVLFCSFLALTTLYIEPIEISTRFYSSEGASINPLTVFVRIIGYLTISIVISNIYIKYDIWRTIKYVFILNSLLISLSLFIESFTGFNFFSQTSTVDIVMEGVSRVRGPFGDPNSSAAMTIPGIVALFSFLIFEKQNLFKSIIFLLLIIVIFWGVSLTASRTALVGILIVFPSVLVLNKSILSTRKKLFYVIMAISLGSSLITFISRGRTLSLEADRSAQSRSDLFSLALNIAEDNPIFGVGYNYGFHNNFSDIMVSGGFIILFIFILFNVKLLLSLYKGINNEIFWIFFSLVLSFFIVGLGISWINNLLYWVIIGLSLSCIIHKKSFYSLSENNRNY